MLPMQKAVTNNRELAAAMGRKGGAVKSQAKTLAAQLRELRKKGLTDEATHKLQLLMEDPQYSELDLLIFLQGLRGKADGFGDLAGLAKLMLEWHKVRHGSKEHSDVLVNVDNRDYKFVVEVRKSGVVVGADGKTDDGVLVPPRQDHD